jgi:hypothetical protein
MGENITPHKQCLMGSEWSKLYETLKHNEENRVLNDKRMLREMQAQIISQAKINTSNAAMLSQLTHKIFGNDGSGLNSDVRANRMEFLAENKRIEDAIGRLWWAFGAISVMLLGNFVGSFFIK